MKKYIIGIILVLSFPLSSFANPLALIAIPMWACLQASFVFHSLVATALTIEWSAKVGEQKVSSVGDIEKGSTVQWINASDMSLNTKDLVAKMPFDKVNDLANSSNNYPLLKDALSKNVGIDYPIISESNTSGNSTVVGSKGLLKNSLATLIGFTHSSTGGCSNICYGSDAGGQSFTDSPSAGYTTIVQNYNYGGKSIWTYSTGGVIPPPVTRPATPSEFKAAVSPDGSPLSDPIRAEIDKMFQDPSYVPTFSDATTGLPYSPPPDSTVATQSQVDQYNKSLLAAEAAKTAASSAQAAATSAQAAATNAGNNYASSGGNPNTGVGGDPALYQKYLDAKAAAKAAQSNADKLAADDAKDDSDVAATLPTSAERKTLNFSGLNSIKGALDNTYPFNLPSVISGYYSSWVVDPAPPVFNLPLPLGQTIHVDLAPFQPVATLIQYLIGMISTVGCLYYIIHFFRGIS